LSASGQGVSESTMRSRCWCVAAANRRGASANPTRLNALGASMLW
jgi:hypothetical protein